MIFLRSVLPIPPSSNRIYRRRGNMPGMYLTKEAEQYKEAVKAQLFKEGSAFLRFPPDMAYQLTLLFRIDVLNKGYPQTAKSRYKRVDLSNRIKILEDALQEITQVDDSQTFSLLLEKRQRKPGDSETVEIFLCTMEDFEWQ